MQLSPRHRPRSRWLPRTLALCFLLSALLLPTPSWGIRVVTYNVLNYQGGRITELQLIFNAIDADIIVLQEVDSLSAAAGLLTNVLNGAGGPGGYSFGTFTTDGTLTNNALYYRNTVVSFSGSHIDVNTSPRETDRWRLTLVGYPGEFLYVYGMHLKAGSTSSNQDDREVAAALIRTNANLLPPDSNFILAGDYNIRSSTEASYQNLIGSQADNTGRAVDPINSPGTWNNNSSFALIHTQSPHSNNPGAPGGAASGGIDDRFDFLLMSQALVDGDGLAYVPGTYRTYGNDGLHFNADINDAPTIPEGAAMANALHGASDHLPVIADLQVPAKLSFTSTLTLPTVVVGATNISAPLTITNSGDLATFGFVDQLTYALGASVGITVPPGMFFDAAGGSSNNHTVSLNAPSAGAVNGLVTINSNVGTEQVTVNGSVLRHSVPSLAPTSQQFTVTADFGSHTTGSFTDQQVDVYNFGYDALQASMEVFAASFTGPDAARFSLVGGFSPATIAGGSQPFTIAFDDSGPSGTYSATLLLDVRDDMTLPGATGQGSLAVTLTASLASGNCPTPFIRGDVNDDAVVNIGDPVFILAFLFSQGAAPAPAEEGDANGDGGTDVADSVYLLAYLFGTGAPPPAPFPGLGCP